MIRNAAYDYGWLQSHAMSVPIVSVGNISVGGTGKTPMAEFLLQKLLEMGHQPAYLSRGYGRSTKGYLQVDPSADDGRRFGDESFQVATKFANLPVVVCEDRVAGVERLLKEFPLVDVVVLDDAFQHRRIRRDFDLVMVDANRLPWKDLMLPAGNLREPVKGMKRADAIVFSKYKSSADADRLVARYGKTHNALAFSLEQKGMKSFFGKPIPEDSTRRTVAFAGLGNNTHFFAQVKTRFPALERTFAFPDHHPYRLRDLRKILSEAGHNTEKSTNLAGALILTSEKDFFRLKNEPWLRSLEHLPLYYIPVALEAHSGLEKLEQQLNQMFDKYHGKNS